MREMHKWKDKVEFSLDNRQIFFLFFGLSVVGCFVFALGVMTGRRIDWEPDGQVAALGGQSLELLDENGADLTGFSFKEGLEESTVADLPPTRDPAVPPRSEEELAAAAKVAPAAPPSEVEVAAPTRGGDPEPRLPKAVESTLAAAGQSDSASSATPKVFTLQMKAFSRQDEAEQFADKLRRNGHDIRVEPAQVRGRTWYRVRLGSFGQWDQALAAKAEFEKAEHVIAYVVSE